MSEHLQRLINQKLQAKVASDIELHDKAQNRKQTWDDVPGAWESLRWHILQIVSSSVGVLASRSNPKTGDLQVTNTVDRITLNLEKSVTGTYIYAICKKYESAWMNSIVWTLMLRWHLRDGVLLLVPENEPFPDDLLNPTEAAEVLMRRLLSETVTKVTKVTGQSV